MSVGFSHLMNDDTPLFFGLGWSYKLFICSDMNIHKFPGDKWKNINNNVVWDM